MNLLSNSHRGYSLIELVVVIIIIGILATIVLKSLGGAADLTRTEETKREMNLLAHAIAGNPDLVSGGIRTDYGYIGDIGSLPPNWEALVTNPGEYATWNGPYIKDEFAAGSGDTEFRQDAWGRNYSSPSSIGFTSTGGGFTITRDIARSLSDLFANSVYATITDIDNSPPGLIYRDSIRILIIIPDGSGAYLNVSSSPGADGYCRLDSIPIGKHALKMIYIPTGDTLTREIAIEPGHDKYINLQYFDDVW